MREDEGKYSPRSIISNTSKGTVASKKINQIVEIMK